MRNFIIFSRKGVTSPDFSLNDLPGSGGRMDLVCRCVNSALWISHGVRDDTNIYIVLNGPPDPPITIVFKGNSIKRVSPDERNIASWIKKAIASARGKEWTKVQDGILSSKKSFQDVIRELKDNPIYVLHENGKFLDEIEIKKNPVFVLGDHIGLPKKEEFFVKRFNCEKISLGKISYLASHCITIMNYEMDKRRI